MRLSYWILFVALVLSTIAAYYSILGLVTIFSAAAIPIIVMATAMEVSKVSITVWLHRYWDQVKWAMRLYLVPAVVILMLITSMGIFGLLSKAHTGQAAENADITAKISIFDEKIKTERENIDMARQALSQMNASVDQTLARSTSEGGASRAVQVRKQQAKERATLQKDIDDSQSKISALQEQRAPIAAQQRHADAEVGPIRYVAALIYGDNPDSSTLERAVRFVIIMLVSVFDPLAIFMVLAANESLKWEKQKLGRRFTHTASDPLAPEVELPQDFASIMERHISEDEVAFQEIEDRVDDMVERVEHAVELLSEDHGKLTRMLDERNNVPVEEEIISMPEEEIITSEEEHKLETIWEEIHPGFTTEEHRALFKAGLIDYLPWLQQDFKERALAGKFNHLIKKD